MEIWKAIPNWEGLYEVSDLGQVRSLNRVVKGRSGPTRYQGRVLKTSAGMRYPHVTLVNTGEKGRREVWHVHDLVLLVFVGLKPIGLEACHANDIGSDNQLTNLRYDTRSANSREGLINRGYVYKTDEEKKRKARETKEKWRARRRELGLRVT